MKTNITSKALLATVAASFLSFAPLCSGDLFTNTVEKVYDLGFSVDGQGNIYGGYQPSCKPTLVGTNLIFTTGKGGLYGLGTISSFSLISHIYNQVGTFGVAVSNNVGSNPLDAVTMDGNIGYFTCNNGGLYNKGTIGQVDLTPGANYGNITVLYNFTNVLYTNASGVVQSDGQNPHTGITKIGDDLWTMNQLGGISNHGAIVKFNLTSGMLTVVTNFDGPLIGNAPYANPILVNGAFYFTTFMGGIPIGTPGEPNGGGTLERMTIDGSGNVVITKLVNMPLFNYATFPCSTPCLVGTNYLYFTTTGPTTNPGAIIRYTMDAGTWTNLFSFTTNADHKLQYGTVPGYAGMTEWLGELYFIPRNGGISNVGVVAKYNIASNTVVKLADLTGPRADSLGGDSLGFDNDGLVVMETNHYFLYYLVYAGGANAPSGQTSGCGTIIRVYLPPFPIQSTIARANSTNVTLSWTGGYPPYDILTNSVVTAPLSTWSAITNGIDSTTDTTNWSVTLPVFGDSLYYQIRGQSQ